MRDREFFEARKIANLLLVQNHNKKNDLEKENTHELILRSKLQLKAIRALNKGIKHFEKDISKQRKKNVHARSQVGCNHQLR